MDSQSSRKIIVAGGLAAVVGISVVAFALSSHHPPSAAPISQSPATVAPTPDVTAAVAPTPGAPAAVAQLPAPAAAVAPVPDAPAVAHKDSVDSKIDHTANRAAVEPKVAGNRRLAKAPTSADTTDRVVTPAEPTIDSSEKPAGDTLAKSVDGMKGVDEVTLPPAASGTSPQEGAGSTAPAPADAGSPPPK